MDPSATPLNPEALAEQAGFLRSLARGLVFGDLEADDLVQETWVRALERPPRQPESLRAWLGRVARRLALDSSRSARRRSRRQELAARPEGASSPAEVFAFQEELLAVAAAVKALPEPLRMVVHLRYYEGLTRPEIARRLGEPVDTIKSRLKRALQLLRERLDGEHGGERESWCLVLAPFLEVAPEAEGAMAVGSLVAGGTVMSLKVQSLLAVGALLLGLALWQVLSGTPSPPEDAWRKATARMPAVMDGKKASAFRPWLSRDEGEPRERPRREFPSPAGRPENAYIEGRVVDEDGKPVAGAGLTVMARSSSSGKSGYGDDRYEYAISRTTAEEGRYRVEFPFAGSEAVRVILDDVRFRAVEKIPPEWRTPLRAPDLVVFRLPHGTILVKARDRTTGRRLEEFGCRIDRLVPDPGGGARQVRMWMGGRTSQGEIERHLPLASPGETVDIRVTLGFPASPVPAARDLILRAGERTEVVLDFDPGGWGLVGRVLDEVGRPLSDAVVFFGDEYRGRSGFGSFRAEKVPDGVRSAADGSFRLLGSGREVTARHQDYSPATVPAASAGEIHLQSLGGIEGELVDGQGRPRPGVGVELNLDQSTRTDDKGRFRFDRVAAGVQWLLIPGPAPGRLPGPDGGPWGVRVEPGRVARLRLDGGLSEVVVGVFSGGRPWPEAFQGVLVGRGRSFSVVEVQAAAGRFTVRGVLPGEYILLSGRGLLAPFAIQGREAMVELGTATLAVRAKPGWTLALAPMHDEAYMHLLAASVVRSRVPPAGEIVFGPLPAGAYELSRGDAREGEEVLIAGPGAKVDWRGKE